MREVGKDAIVTAISQPHSVTSKQSGTGQMGKTSTASIWYLKLDFPTKTSGIKTRLPFLNVALDFIGKVEF